MLSYNLLLFAHILLFAYWLGSDVGVFYGVRYVLRSDLSIETRKTVMSLVHWIDAFPRICLVLMVPVGSSLALTLGLLNIPEHMQTPFLVGIWSLGLVWLWMVLRIYGGVKGILTRIDFVIRVSTMLTFFVMGVLSFSGRGLFMEGAEWLGMKAILFSLIIACGLALRLLGKPFGEAYAKVMAGESTPEVEENLRAAMMKSKRVVVILWALVAMTAYLGVTKTI